MAKRNVDAEGSEHEQRKASADKRIGAQQDRMEAKRSSGEQKAKDQLLMNEMRSNKASVELNSALHYYDKEKTRDKD